MWDAINRFKSPKRRPYLTWGGVKEGDLRGPVARQIDKRPFLEEQRSQFRQWGAAHEARLHLRASQLQG